MVGSNLHLSRFSDLPLRDHPCDLRLVLLLQLLHLVLEFLPLRLQRRVEFGQHCVPDALDQIRSGTLKAKRSVK